MNEQTQHHALAVGLLALIAGLPGQSWGQGLTVQVGAGPPPPTFLVRHSDLWRYHKGTNHPGAGWQTRPEAELDSTWLTGPGGFGYEDNDDATVLTDMFNGYTTLYICKSFEITEPVDPLRHLVLVMDWDDGFIAWLDGVEIARSSNAPGAVGTEPPHTAVSLPPNHEASAGPGGNPPTTFDLGPVGTRLAPGTHVLAVLGLNGAINSSDFSLIADLLLVGGAGTAVSGDLFTLVTANTVLLSGSNTLSGSTRVVVNGWEAQFDPTTKLWSKSQSLVPGLNRLFIAALDDTGTILTSAQQDIVYEAATQWAGGTLTGSTHWRAEDGVVRLTNELVVPGGASLQIEPGVVVLVSSNAAVRVLTNGVVTAQGTPDQPVWFLPADGASPWRELSARGLGATLTLRGVELVAGQVIAHPGGLVEIEDSLLRDFRSSTRLFLAATNGAGFTLRRSHVLRYDQIRFAATPVQIEDCLFEQIGSDGTDVADHPNIQVRRTTYRYAQGANTDALDLGGAPGMSIEQCLIHDIPDKAISVADLSHGVTIRNCLIYRCGIGVAAYAASNCVISQSTVADCITGLSLYTRAGHPGPGLASGTNLIVWGNITNIHLAGGGALALSYSDVQGGPWPGAGNISVEPRFVDAACGDYRLAPDSPVRGTGLGGTDPGAVLPVGGLPPAPYNLAARAVSSGGILVWWQEDAPNESGFELQRSTNGTDWTWLTNVGPNVVSFTDLTVAPDRLYFYRVRAVNGSGASRFSNVASGIWRTPTVVLGGPLQTNTLLSPAVGTVVVAGPVTVPAGVTLSVQPGTVLRLTNGASIRAVHGGAIHIQGSAEAPVRLVPLHGTNLWGELSAQFTDSELVIRHAEIAGGQVTVYSNALLVLEDSYLHDYRLDAGGTLFTQPILLAHYAQPTTVRRCVFREYYEVLLRNGRHLLEDCLFEHPHGDGLDFDAAWPGTVVRRCTFRHGRSGNIDAVDVGNDGNNRSVGVIIEDCLMYDFPYDKGVSIGENSTNILVRNCFIHHVSRGVQVKDLSEAAVHHCTILHAEIGLHCYEKIARTGGGRLTNSYNNIVWYVTNAIVIETNSVLVVAYTDLQNTNWPGPGNFSAEPQFVNLAELDCRLGPSSPCRGAGRDGDDLGARLPVGCFMAPSNPVLELVAPDSASSSPSAVALRFWADSERSYSIQWADRLDGPWTKLIDVFPDTLPRPVTVSEPLGSGGQRFYRLVSPAQP